MKRDDPKLKKKKEVDKDFNKPEDEEQMELNEYKNAPVHSNGNKDS